MFLGQKQRVSIARAAYAQLFFEQEYADVEGVTGGLVLLDDPLSALDAGTAKTIFDRLLKGCDALLANAAVVLVTHASHFLSCVDNIIVLVDGVNEFTGSWAALASFKASNTRVATFIESISSSIQETAAGKKESKTYTLNRQRPQANDDVPVDALMTIEEREFGLSSPTTWLLWFKHAGGFFFLSFQVIFMSIDRFAYVAVEYWLARWTNGAETPIFAVGIEFDPQTDGRTAQYRYLTVYSSLILVSVLATIMRSLWSVTGGSRAAKSVFASMLARVLRAPMSYFESTPQGRLLNRFTYDTVSLLTCFKLTLVWLCFISHPQFLFCCLLYAFKYISAGSYRCHVNANHVYVLDLMQLVCRWRLRYGLYSAVDRTRYRPSYHCILAPAFTLSQVWV